MMEKCFRLTENNTTARTEVLCGLTTFLTMMYILFANTIGMGMGYQPLPSFSWPALILAGSSMLTRMRHIDWRNFEESFPAFVTILFMPLAYGILDGPSGLKPCGDSGDDGQAAGSTPDSLCHFRRVHHNKAQRNFFNKVISHYRAPGVRRSRKSERKRTVG